MADKDDEIDKILSEIKGSKASSEEEKSAAEDTEKAKESNVKEEEKPLEPALNELPVTNKKSINDYKDEYEEEEVEYVKNPAKKKILIGVIAAVFVIAVAVAVYFGVFYENF